MSLIIWSSSDAFDVAWGRETFAKSSDATASLEDWARFATKRSLSPASTPIHPYSLAFGRERDSHWLSRVEAWVGRLSSRAAASERPEASTSTFHSHRLGDNLALRSSESIPRPDLQGTRTAPCQQLHGCAEQPLPAQV